MLAKIAEGIPVEGMESLTPALVGRLVPLTDYLPVDAAVAVLSPERVATRAVSLAETNRVFLEAAWSAATAGAAAPIDLQASLDTGDFLTVSALRAEARPRTWWSVSPFDADDDEVTRLDGRAIPSFAGQVDGAASHVVGLTKGTAGGGQWAVAIAAAGTGLVDRAAQVLAEHEVAARIVDAVPSDPEPGVAYLVTASVEAGFEQDEARFALLSEAEFYGRSAGIDSRQPKKLASRRRNVVDPLQLKAGDHVVHETHGIGRFIELVTREVTGGGRVSRGPLGTQHEKVTREYLVLEYASS
jgi:transcription-repair coupling factor (superfamily II helicase)